MRSSSVQLARTFAAAIPRADRAVPLQRAAAVLSSHVHRVGASSTLAELRRGRAALPWSEVGTGRRFLQVDAGDLRKGDFVELKGKRCEVVKTSKNITNRKAFAVLEFRDLVGNAKRNETIRVDQKIEKIWATKTKMTLLYHDGTTAFFQHPETFENVDVPCELIGDSLVWLQDDADCLIHTSENGDPIYVEIPDKLKCKVESTVVGGVKNTKAVLANGKIVAVPQFIEAGDVILVNITDETFAERVS